MSNNYGVDILLTTELHQQVNWTAIEYDPLELNRSIGRFLDRFIVEFLSSILDILDTLKDQPSFRFGNRRGGLTLENLVSR